MMIGYRDMIFEEELVCYIANTYGMIRIDATRYPKVYEAIKKGEPIMNTGIRRSAQMRPEDVNL